MAQPYCYLKQKKGWGAHGTGLIDTRSEEGVHMTQVLLTYEAKKGRYMAMPYNELTVIQYSSYDHRATAQFH